MGAQPWQDRGYQKVTKVFPWCDVFATRSAQPADMRFPIRASKIGPSAARFAVNVGDQSSGVQAQLAHNVVK
jgi:hypothetical protein